MRRSNRELWAALIACLIATLVYLVVTTALGGIPGASSLFGHSLGIFGFLLMLMTETLYSYRKRARRARWGHMSNWLDFHIFTGIFGPFLVLLHSSWKFNGLAGLVLLMTVLIVLSGFVGRYFYTAIPRSVDGIELEAGQIRSQIQAAEAGIVQYLQDNPQAGRVVQPLLAAAAPANTQPLALLLAYPWIKIRTGLVWWSARRKIDPSLRPTVDRLAQLARRRNDLYRQVRSLVTARRMMSLWHAIHIPLGLTLFMAAFIHIGAAIYYATLLR
jgi:hypothetical protein